MVHVYASGVVCVCIYGVVYASRCVYAHIIVVYICMSELCVCIIIICNIYYKERNAYAAMFHLAVRIM